jgi:transcriptional regulator with XRE-family HTH domain
MEKQTKDIKQIIANNLITLRKKHKLTQNELAKKLNYSDNAISRWERGELAPSVEVLQSISEVYDVPIEYLLKENTVQVLERDDKNNMINKLATTLLSVSIIWFAVTVAFVYCNTFFEVNMWRLFVWAVPASCLVLLTFNQFWRTRTYKFVVLTVLNWTSLISIYLQLLEYNMWLVFIVGIPTQVALVVWAFIKPKKAK